MEGGRGGLYIYTHKVYPCLVQKYKGGVGLEGEQVSVMAKVFYPQ